MTAADPLPCQAALLATRRDCADGARVYHCVREGLSVAVSGPDADAGFLGDICGSCQQRDQGTSEAQEEGAVPK